MFKSSSLPIHFLRGAIGLLCFGCALSGALPFWTVLPLVGLGLVALRGCPMCWLVGLGETLLHRRKNSPPPPDQVPSFSPAPSERELVHFS